MENCDIKNQLLNKANISDIEKFTLEFKQLCKKYNMNTVHHHYLKIYNVPMVTMFECKDGSSIGILALLNECGFDFIK